MRWGTIEKEFSAPPKLRVELTGGSSDVRLCGTAEPKIRVVLHYHIHAWGPLAGALERKLTESPPCELTDDVLRLGPEPEGVSLDYELVLPNESTVEIKLGSGDLSVCEFSGKFSVATSSGDFWGQKITGEFNLRSGSGDIDLSQAFGSIKILTGSGDVDGANVKGKVDAETGSGDIDFVGFLGDLRLVTGSGDVEVEGELDEETWEIRTGSGDVDLILPKDAKMELLLETDSGDVYCDFPCQKAWEGFFRGTVGVNPKAKIRITTGSGDISLRSR